MTLSGWCRRVVSQWCDGFRLCICVVGLKETVGSVLTASFSIPAMAQNELLLFLVF